MQIGDYILKTHGYNEYLMGELRNYKYFEQIMNIVESNLI